MRIHFFSDCFVFGGSENMLLAILNASTSKDDVDVLFFYRFSPAYEVEMNRRLAPGVPRRGIRLPTPESLWDELHGPARRVVRLLAYLLLVRQLSQLWDIVRLYALFRRDRPDIVHVNNGGFPGAAACNPAAIAARLAGVRRIVYSANNVAVGYASPLRWADYPLDRLTARLVTRFVTASKAAAAALRDVLRLPAGHVSALPNGIDPGVPDEPPAEARAHLGVSQTAIMALVPARLDRIKGHVYLLEAARILLDRDPGAPLVLVLAGAGPEERAIRARVDELELAGRVRFTEAPHEAIWALYGAADVVVLPSLQEDFPYAVLEAMASGLPVIGTRVAGIPEEIVDSVTGLLVEPRDAEALSVALEQLSADPALRSRMGAAGRKRFDELFRAEVAAARYWRLYAELADG